MQWTTLSVGAMVQNYVLATDNKYVVPTGVAIQSIKDSDPSASFQVVLFLDNVSPENANKLRAMSDERCTIVLINLQDPKWKSMPIIEGSWIDLMEFADQIKCAKWSRLVNLRLLFPDIWYSGLLPENVQNVNTFLWLDSDLIVIKSLGSLFDECEHINQWIISANLYFTMYGGVGWVDAQYFDPPSTEQQCKDGFARVSGGVVFWKIRELTDYFVSQGRNELLTLYKERKCKDKVSPQDEVVLGDFLKQRECVYFFSPRYNANPDPKLRLNLFMQWSEFLTEENYFQKMRTGLIGNREYTNPPSVLNLQEAIERFNENMQALCNGDVCIFHWDCVQKPWKRSYSNLYWDVAARHWYVVRQKTPFRTCVTIPPEMEINLTE
ncbi:MAG: hypothetical protein LBB19_01265 [Puniceicoccales bacterium]|nr:hypothetical protein [Puniceicoccales bacterium]